MPANPNLDLNFPDVMNLRLAAVYVDLSEQRLRTVAREGTVKGTKTEDGAWSFTKKDLDAYLEMKATQPRGGGRRGDGKLWIIRVKYENLEAVKAALEPFGIELQPRYNYQKQKEYREKRKKDKAAQKAAKASS
jgi:hypothetical protein